MKRHDRVFVPDIQRYGRVELYDPLRGWLVRYEGDVIPATGWHFETRTIPVATQTVPVSAHVAWLQRVEDWFLRYMAHPQTRYPNHDRRKAAFWALHEEAQRILEERPS